MPGFKVWGKGFEWYLLISEEEDWRWPAELLSRGLEFRAQCPEFKRIITRKEIYYDFL